MKQSLKYTVLGSSLMLAAFVFLAAGTLELAKTGTFDGIAGMAQISSGHELALQNAGAGGGVGGNLNDGGGNDNDGGGEDNDGGGYEPKQGTVSGGLTNPLKSATLEGFLLAILDILLVFAMPIIVLFIMYAGFLYVTAQGDPGKIKTAHSALTWSVVGGVIIFGSKLIIEVIQNTVNTL